MSERRFGLSPWEVEALTQQFHATNQIPNPYRSTSTYGAIVQALINLGVNFPHQFTDVRNEVRRLMGEDRWHRFSEKPAREGRAVSGADVRLHQNARTLQRTKDYGRKLFDVGEVIGTRGVVIDVVWANDDFLYRLDRNSTLPVFIGPGQVSRWQRVGLATLDA